MVAAGYDLRRSTLWRYKKLIETTGSPLSTDKESGAPRALSAEQHQLLIGFAVKKFAERKRCTTKDGFAFVKDHLGVSVHKSTVRNYFLEGGLKNKKVVFKAKSAMLTMGETVEMIQTFIMGERSVGNLGFNQLFCTVDFVYLSHRKTNLHSYSPGGLGVSYDG